MLNEYPIDKLLRRIDKPVIHNYRGAILPPQYTRVFSWPESFAGPIKDAVILHLQHSRQHRTSKSNRRKKG